jgi:hypothetical protein
MESRIPPWQPGISGKTVAGNERWIIIIIIIINLLLLIVFLLVIIYDRVLYSYTENLRKSFSFRSVLKKDAAGSFKRW